MREQYGERYSSDCKGENRAGNNLKLENKG